MRLRCPHCGVNGTAADVFKGKRIRCPKCRQEFEALDEHALKEQESVSANEAEVVSEAPLVESVQESVGQDPDDEPVNVKPKTVLAEYTIERLTDSSEEHIEEEPEQGPNEERAAGQSDEVEDEPWSEVNKEAEEIQTVDEVESGEDPEQVACAGCGEAAEDTATFMLVEGLLYCRKCGPAMQDELSTMAQVAALETTGSEDAAEAPPCETDPEAERSDRDITVGSLISSAWKLTKGVKGPIWGGLFVTYGTMFVALVGLGFLAAVVGQDLEGPLGLGLELMSSLFSTLLTAGLMYMGVKQATARRVVWKDIFSGFRMVGRIVVAAILQTLLILIGLLLFIAPGIYLMVGYLLSMVLIIDRKLSPWQAMETSRKAIHRIWWKVFGLYIVMSLIIIVSALPLGIGLIWTVPMSLVLVGVLYAALFGKEKKAD